MRSGPVLPEDAGEIPAPAVSYGAQQVKVPAKEWAGYDWQGRAIKRHRVEIRGAFGFRECTEEDQAQLAEWLAAELCGVELNRDRLAEAVIVRCRGDRMEPPSFSEDQPETTGSGPGALNNSLKNHGPSRTRQHPLMRKSGSECVTSRDRRS